MADLGWLSISTSGRNVPLVTANLFNVAFHVLLVVRSLRVFEPWLILVRVRRHEALNGY